MVGVEEVDERALQQQQHRRPLAAGEAHLTLLKRIVSKGTQKMRGELRFERDHLRFTDHDVDPEIFASCATDENQALLKIYTFLLPGVKAAAQQKSSERRSKSDVPSLEPNTFLLRSLKKGYAFEVIVNRGVPFDGLGIASQNSLNSTATNKSSGYFDLGADDTVKYADFRRGILYVWVLRVDSVGTVIAEAEKQFESLHAGHLSANEVSSEPEELLSEIK